MKINLQSLHFKASARLKDFVDEKVGKLAHMSDDILSAEVVLAANDIKITNNKVCEIRLIVPGNDDFVKKEAASFEEAILDAVEALQRILKQKKVRH